jgi:Zn-dependent hydrolases, including glyoxylases
VALHRLAGRVWLFPHDPDPTRVQPCVAVVAGSTASILVDAGNSPGHARRVREAIDAAGLPPPDTIVYTHHHWDHVWGACAWPSATVVAHRLGADLLHAEAQRPWSRQYLRDQVAANPRLGPSFQARERAVTSWSDFEIITPHVRFDNEITLPGNVYVQHIGGRHAPDSTIVVVPDSGVVLLGDAFYPPPRHLRRPGDGYDHDVIETVRRRYGEGVDWYVHSHGDPIASHDLPSLLENHDAGGAGGVVAGARSRGGDQETQMGHA